MKQQQVKSIFELKIQPLKNKFRGCKSFLSNRETFDIEKENLNLKEITYLSRFCKKNNLSVSITQQAFSHNISILIY